MLTRKSGLHVHCLDVERVVLEVLCAWWPLLRVSEPGSCVLVVGHWVAVALCHFPGLVCQSFISVHFPCGFSANESVRLILKCLSAFQRWHSM